MSLPSATLSLDLDDAWTYMRAAGRPGWEATRSVVPEVCARLLAMLDRHGLRLTLFVIAADLEHPDRVAAIRPFVERGHEIGCHSWHHEPTFAALQPERMREEVLRAADLTEARLGVRPKGFRAPGFAWSPRLPAILREGGFHYDGSPLPTFLGPLCRAYYFFHSKMSKAEREQRKAMYGGIKDAFQSLRPSRYPGDPELWSLPVTTIPLLRTPFHTSYVVWLSRFSRGLASFYLRLGLGLCRLRGVAPSYLLHSLDFVGNGEHRDLDFFPGMDVAWARKEAILEDTLTALRARFTVLPMGEYLAPGRGITARAAS